MSKKTMQKVTFEALIARKIQKEENQYKTENIYIECLDGTLTFHKPPMREIYRLLDEINGETMEGAIAGNARIIYHCCKELQDPKLHKELGVSDPYDVVEKLIDIPDIQELSDKLTIFLGMAKASEKIKN